MKRNWIKKVEFKKAGPFLDATLFGEPNYNVITGANNTGKTFALARISNALDGKELHPDWVSHRKPAALTFLQDNTPEQPRIVIHIDRGERVEMKVGAGNSPSLTVKWLPQIPRCSDRFHVDQPNSWGAITPLFKYWLRLNNVHPLTKFNDLNQTSRDNLISGFEESLNHQMSMSFPFFHWPLRIESQGGATYRIRVVDNHAVSEPRDNGDGFHSMLGLVCECLTQPWPDVLLIDEPERSLHPGAQKELRNFLVKLANEPNGPQVIVATHSPYFLDQRRAAATSVLRWTTTGVQIINRPSIKGGSQELRDALGIEIADTLAFAADVLLVEGECEHDFLVRLLETYAPDEIGSRVIHPWKMSQRDAGVAAEFLQSHKLNFVVVVDNDNGGAVYKTRVIKCLPKAKVFTWDGEFEGLFDENAFIEVAENLVNGTVGDFHDYRTELDDQPLSKQLQNWAEELKLKGTIDYLPSKRDFLAQAVRMIQPNQHGVQQLKKLAEMLTRSEVTDDK